MATRLAAQFFRGIRSLGQPPNRQFGSVSAAMYDYDDYEDESGGQIAISMADSEGSVPERGVQWVMIGERAARRRFYAERLSRLVQVPHISMATLVRQELYPRSSLYEQIANSLNRGKLVPEEIVLALLSKKLEDGYSRGETGFILDGIPRTRIQAEILDQIVGVDLVVNFKCTEESLFKKQVTGKGVCREYPCSKRSGSSLDHHLPADRVHKSTSRAGSSWKDNSKPLEDYYRKQRKLLNFEVSGAPGESWQGLLAALHLQHIDAVNSSQKLTA